MARDVVKVLRATLSYNTWAAPDAELAHPYVVRFGRIASGELYDAAHEAHRHRIRIEAGRARGCDCFRPHLAMEKQGRTSDHGANDANLIKTGYPVNLTNEDIGGSGQSQRQNDTPTQINRENQIRSFCMRGIGCPMWIAAQSAAAQQNIKTQKQGGRAPPEARMAHRPYR